MATKDLLIDLLELARQEATKQLEDAWNLEAQTETFLQDPCLQLDLRDEVSGGRFLDEPDDAPHLNRDNREGEYKFLDKSNWQQFLRIDGLPTAKRALLSTMRKQHEISHRFDVWMTYVGSIDKDLGPAVPYRFRLQTILEPLKFWDTLETEFSNLEEQLEDTEEILTEDCRRLFWQFAIGAVRTSPHMLKAAYTAQHRDEKRPQVFKKIQRFSWVRLLVLLFLPEEELMKELSHAGLAPTIAPPGWHEQARAAMKATLEGKTRGKRRAAIRDGWEDLCSELDQEFVEYSLYTDYTVPDSPRPARNHDDQRPEDAGNVVGDSQHNSVDQAPGSAPSDNLSDTSAGNQEDRQDSQGK